MSCDRYNLAAWINGPTDDGGGHWDECSVSFADDGETTCLCALMDNRDAALDRRDVKALALLGLAVVLAHHGELPEGGALPGCLPEKMVREIEWIVEGDGSAIRLAEMTRRLEAGEVPAGWTPETLREVDGLLKNPDGPAPDWAERLAGDFSLLND